MYQVLLEHISGCMKEKVIENSQHEFTKPKPSLTRPVCLYDKTTRFVDIGIVVNIIYLDIGKVSTPCPTIPMYQS